MPGRNWISTVGGYRYSHNGHEKEDEIFAGAQSAEYWMYDSRLGRRWEQDPIRKPWESPYATFGNNPIYFADPFGLDGEPANPNGTKGGPKEGETCTNPAGSGQSGEIFHNGEWVRNGGELDEVAVTTSKGNSMPAASTGNGPANGQPQSNSSSSESGGSNPKQSKPLTSREKFDKANGWAGLSLSFLEASNKVEKAKNLLLNNKFEAIINNKVQVISTNFYQAKKVYPTISKSQFNLAKSKYAADVAKGSTALKVVRYTGIIGNVAGIGISVMNIVEAEKPAAKDKASLGMGVVGLVPGVGWIPSGAYFLFDFFFPEENELLQNSLERGMEARREYAKDPMNAVVCFKAGTLIYTSKGLYPIENLTTKDSVYSLNTKTKIIELSKISNTLRRETKGVYQVLINSDTINVTSEHPFYIKNIGWIPVRQLKQNDVLINSEGEEIVILNVLQIEENSVVYNLEVEGNHNYFITQEKVLVHNKKIVNSKSRKRKRRSK